MMTKGIWEDFLVKRWLFLKMIKDNDKLDYLAFLLIFTVLLTPFSFILDILLLPFEIIYIIARRIVLCGDE